MAKRKDRRVPADPNRGLNRVEHAVQRDRTDSSSSSSIRFTTYFCIGIFIPMISFGVYRMKYASHTEGIATAIVSSSVYERGLVKPNINYQEILNENSDVSNNSTRRHYTYPILAYITPWNSRGYDLAKRFNSKFTHLSPVWYDLKSEGIRLVLEGRHNADIGWLSELRKSGPALVLPRVVLEAFPNELLKKKKKRNEAINLILAECKYASLMESSNGRSALVLPRIVLEAFPNELLKKKKKRNEAIDLILAECKEMKYDGIVLESWSRWAAYGVLHDQQMRSKALQFVKELGQALHSVSSVRNPEHYLQLVYVIGPPRSKNLQEHDFGPEDLQTLGDAVDGFSLMTYDFSGPQNPGPNAPLKWIKSTLELLLSNSGNKAQSLARKIFLGINFYGNDFVLSQGQGGGAITGRDYLSLLEKHRPTVKWDEDSEEHLFAYSDKQGIKHAVFYPTLMSISMRLEEARMWGAGISIWEIGQANGYDLELSPSVHSFAVLRARFKGKLIAKNVGLA